jgi:hypothetical protein
MKKLLLFVLAMLPMVVGAQINDEIELVGIWKLTDSGGEFTMKKYSDYSMQKPNALKFYAECNTLTDDSLGVGYFPNEYKGIRDYYITSNNILHVLYSHRAQRYRITYYDGNNITLETLDNKAWIKMSREGTASVPAIKEDEDANKQYYNLEGELIYEPKKGINIINGKKYMIK